MNSLINNYSMTEKKGKIANRKADGGLFDTFPPTKLTSKRKNVASPL